MYQDRGRRRIAVARSTRRKHDKSRKIKARVIVALAITILSIATMLFLGFSGKEQSNAGEGNASISSANSEIIIRRIALETNGDDTADKNEMSIKFLSAIGESTVLNSLNGDDPTILIYHTHTLEAYTASDENPYKESGGKWRTHDNTKNIVAVGEKLKNELEDYGFNVIHDITNHEPPKLSTAYERSLKTMQEYKSKYPSLVLFIDVHRDASGEQGKTDYCVVDGEQAARLMFVVGTGKGATGTGYKEKPDFDSNFALASAITERLNAINKSLTREIRVKKGRYNQHVSNQCLLVEVGHNMNTLEQALHSIDYLAYAIAEVCGGD